MKDPYMLESRRSMPLKTRQDNPWRPLNTAESEIRVIEICPAKSRRDAIICHLRTISLLDKSEYEALSYVWGASSDTKRILIDGNETLVTDSLFEAFTHLRDVKMTRTLWVDALCINQKDDNEKSIQVRIMDKIYAQASTVLVWLLNSESPKLLHDINRHSQNQESHFTEFPISMLVLSKISWWHRAWTFQEAALAKDLVFYTGYRCFSLEDLEGYCKSLHRHLFRDQCCQAVYAVERANNMSTNELISAHVIVQELLSSRRSISQGQGSLLDIIVNNRGRVATNVRDRVYAYLGLAYDVPTDLVRYELPLREWTLHVSTKIIQHNKSLKILHYASPSEFTSIYNCRMEGLPSWCPDWTQSMESSLSLQAQERDKYLYYRRFSASGHAKANPCFPTPEVLGVSGVVCDTVTHVGCDSSNIHGAGADVQTLRQWCHLAAHNNLIHHAKCDECDKKIPGIRNKCRACPDFDLCSRCFDKSADIHPKHSFISIRARMLESEEKACIQYKRTKSLFLLEEPNTTTNLDKPPGIAETKLKKDIVKTSAWEWLSKIAYPFADGGTLQDAFWKVLTADINPKMALLHESIESREASIFLKIAFAKFWHLRVENQLEAAFNLEEGYTMEPGGLASRALDEKSIKTVASLVRMVVWEMRFFVSSKGYIGWGPRTMMPGDTIAVLHGGDMPFVLRQVPEQLSQTNHGSGYTVIGECYVHGLMRGEALDNEDMEKRDFLLY